MAEINLDELETDITGWSDYCLGYHTLKVPPGLTSYPHQSTQIDWHQPKIEQNFLGTARDYILTHPNFGETLFETQVNGWDFIAASRRIDETLLSDRILIFFGAKKVGSDVILFTQDASFSRVGDIKDPKYRMLYTSLIAEPVTADNRAGGFCYDGYVFKGYKPANNYTFSVDFAGVPTNGSNGYQADRHGYWVSLSQEMIEPTKDDRPVAQQPTAADFAHIIDVTETVLTKNGFNGVLTRFSGVGDKADEHSFKSLIIGPYSDLGNPVYTVDTTENIHPLGLDEGQEEILSLLKHIISN